MRIDNLKARTKAELAHLVTPPTDHQHYLSPFPTKVDAIYKLDTVTYDKFTPEFKLNAGYIKGKIYTIRKSESQTL